VESIFVIKTMSISYTHLVLYHLKISDLIVDVFFNVRPSLSRPTHQQHPQLSRLRPFPLCSNERGLEARPTQSTQMNRSRFQGNLYLTTRSLVPYGRAFRDDLPAFNAMIRRDNPANPVGCKNVAGEGGASKCGAGDRYIDPGM
jgi:hypothetical protein